MLLSFEQKANQQQRYIVFYAKTVVMYTGPKSHFVIPSLVLSPHVSAESSGPGVRLHLHIEYLSASKSKSKIPLNMTQT